MDKDILQCPYRVNDPLENELTYSSFKEYCKTVQGGVVISPPGNYKKPWGGCKKIREIVSSRYFNRYRGLYTMPTIDDMVQEAYIGMLLHKDYFTKESPADEKAAISIISQAIRKHFKKLYRDANLAGRNFDNGRHNARIEPKQKPLKVLIDELDFDPAKEPESVKQANDIRRWRIGGISKVLVNQTDFDPEKDPESVKQDKNKAYIDVIHFYDPVNDKSQISPAPYQLLHEKTMGYKPKKRILENITEKDYPCSALWPEDIRPGAPRKLKNRLPVQHDYAIEPFTYSVNDWTYDNNYIVAERAESYCFKTCLHYGLFCDGQKIATHYKQIQTKTPVKKLKIETEISYKYKRKDEAAALELINLHHAAIFPDHKQPDKKKIFLQPGAVSYNRFADTNFIDGRLDLITILQKALLVINTMPHPQRCVMQLYYYQGLTQSEVSNLLHRSTRKVQLARAEGMQQIKQRFDDQNISPDIIKTESPGKYIFKQDQGGKWHLLEQEESAGLMEQHFNAKYSQVDIISILEKVRKLILNREILPL